jgi:KEOPS complex subunit Cgi121
MGVDEGETPVVVVVDGGNEATAADAVAALPGVTPAETLGDFDADRVRAFFEVSEAELAAVDGTLADVVLERVALLDVEK